MLQGHQRKLIVAGVLYAEDFDVVCAEPVPPHAMLPAIEPETIAPRFNLEEFQAATEQSFEDGREFERNQARHGLDRQRADCLAVIAAQLESNRDHCTQLLEQGLEAIARATLILVTSALPSLCASHAESELVILLRQILPPLQRLPELRIRAHPQMRLGLEPEVRSVLDPSDTRIIWTDSDTLLPGDIALSWHNGSALRDTGSTCAAIRDSVLALFDPGKIANPAGTTDA